MDLLDVAGTYVERDPSGLRERLLSLPEQAVRGWEIGGAIESGGIGEGVSRVVIAGMGGSGIGGEMIRGLADVTAGSAQVSTWRDYGAPAWVDGSTLVVAVSVSGSTAETRSAFAAAGEAGARRIAVTGRGPMLGEARAAGAPVVELDWDGEPRAALGYTFVAPLRALGAMGLVPLAEAELEEAVEHLRDVAGDLAVERPVALNVAKQIATELDGAMPVIFGSGHMVGVAMRWKTQFNENANSWAAWEALPEAGHNTVQGYASGRHDGPRPYGVVLRPESRTDGDGDVIEAHLELMSDGHVPNMVLDVAAPNRLGEVLVGALLGDMVSYYAAVLRGVDPSATGNIDALKGRRG